MGVPGNPSLVKAALDAGIVHLDIPTMMRSYMYAYGYKNPAKAKETLQFLDLSNLACNRCPTCHVQCTMGFDVRDKVIDIARIKHVPKEFLV